MILKVPSSQLLHKTGTMVGIAPKRSAIMNHKFLFSIIFLFLALLLITAGTYNQNLSRSLPERDNPPVDFQGIGPPVPVLTINGLTQTGGLGTFCWSDIEQGVSLCADAVGVPTLSKPLAPEMETGSPILLHFQLADLAPISDLVLYVIPVTPNDELTEVSGSEMRWWPFLETATQHLLTPAHNTEIELTLDPGLYVFNLFAIWESLGDGSFGFLIKVR
jgi:hypothetical protein